MHRFLDLTFQGRILTSILFSPRGQEKAETDTGPESKQNVSKGGAGTSTATATTTSTDASIGAGTGTWRSTSEWVDAVGRKPVAVSQGVDGLVISSSPQDARTEAVP